MFNVLLTLLLLVAATGSASAATRYVWQSSPSPAPPYTNWLTAATNIQDAVDAAQTGDEIVVTNGTYATGGRAVGTNLLVNRVAVDKPLTLRSVNGPQFTVIQGYQVPGTTNGDGAIRCVYLTNGASLSGFTLTNGATRLNYYPADYTREQSGGGLWCESSAVISNCVMVGNSANGNGGGTYGGTLNNCTLTGNSAQTGGGASDCTLNNCTLTGNSASYYGGGTRGSTLNNCTLTGNSARVEGGGADAAILNNCIIHYNTALLGGANYTPDCVLNYCCTTPLPTSGTGNLSLDPQLASAIHLSATSPCRGAGSAAFATGADIDGEVWANPPSIGCDEYHAGAVTGPLSVGLTAAYTNVAVGFPVEFTALIEGRTTGSRWDFGDAIVSNRPYASHVWAAPGDYAVVLRGYNESNPGGVSATVSVHVVEQPVHYVSASGTNSVPPYTSWATAATNIQDAVDAASVTGAMVLVTNGTYATGGRTVGTNLLVNRVAVDKPLTLRSVNGPQFTIIQGYQVPGTTNGDGAIRCVYLTNDASLSGFTLTNGATHSVDDDRPPYRESSGGGVWCESTDAVVSNCVMTSNSAYSQGGGAFRGTHFNCTLIRNAARSGGGAAGCVLNGCVLIGNSAESGGGAGGSTLDNCSLTGNSASGGGGGASVGTLNNCLLTGNSADHGGGTYGGTLNNCTVTGNSAASNCGGVVNSEFGLRLNNCIVYSNTAPTWANYEPNAEMNYCCTTPLPVPQPWEEPFVGNISLDPQLVDAAHLSAGSPCRGAGSVAYATGSDIDGKTWATPPSIGCDEYHAGAVTGPLSVRIAADYTNVAVGFTVRLTALIEGRASLSRWEFGDGLALTNQIYTSHAWSGLGDYAVVLRVYSESNPSGVSATVTVHVAAQPVYYVSAGNTNPVPPYTSWETAATNIQDAVDVAAAGGTVLVTNGIYATGGRAVHGTMTNRVAVDRPLMLRSVNGPQYTVIQGYQVPGTTNGDGAIRCVYLLADFASLSGFTLTKGATGAFGAAGGDRNQSGGGVYCNSPNATLTNCIITSNSAERGGGAAGGTLNNCMLTGNLGYYGGGAYYSMLNSCTLTGNSASEVGGAYGGTLNNCIVYFNTAPHEANYLDLDALGFILNYCCTTPFPTYGVGNITNSPLFVNYAGGNLRLQSNSPCINSGLNAHAPGPTDLDGLPRTVSGTVDIGAYEFRGPGSVISYAWLQHYGLPTDGSADATDSDGDSHNLWQEWHTGTNPTNALSVLRLLSASPAGTNVTVSWQSVAGVTYFLERSPNLTATPVFTLLATNLVGQPGTTSYADTNAAPLSPLFYRVGVGQ